MPFFWSQRWALLAKVPVFGPQKMALQVPQSKFYDHFYSSNISKIWPLWLLFREFITFGCDLGHISILWIFGLILAIFPCKIGSNFRSKSTHKFMAEFCFLKSWVNSIHKKTPLNHSAVLIWNQHALMLKPHFLSSAWIVIYPQCKINEAKKSGVSEEGDTGGKKPGNVYFD